MKLTVLYIIALLTFTACKQNQTAFTPVHQAGDDWQISSLQQAGIDSLKMQEMWGSCTLMAAGGTAGK